MPEKLTPEQTLAVMERMVLVTDAAACACTAMAQIASDSKVSERHRMQAAKLLLDRVPAELWPAIKHRLNNPAVTAATPKE